MIEKKTIYNTVILVRSVIKLLGRNFLFICVVVDIEQCMLTCLSG